MSQPNLAAMRAVADRLDSLGLDYAFVGGSIVNLLLDNPALSPARPTDDVDVILETVTSQRYSDLEVKLRGLGFDHDMREKAPKCRWVLGDLTVDIMPTKGAFLGLNTAWFKEALATATVLEIAHTRLKLISPVAFLATKHVAFADRGDDDYPASHDLEDFLTVIDGRENIVAEVNEAPAELRGYVIQSIRFLVPTAAFDEALPGHLPPDRASQQRLPNLRRKLHAIAALA
jgi:predicted nucleotidyltransferase